MSHDEPEHTWKTSFLIGLYAACGMAVIVILIVLLNAGLEATADLITKPCKDRGGQPSLIGCVKKDVFQ